MAKREPEPGLQDAETVGLAALAFLAEDAPRLGRFLALTGIGPDQLRSAADAPETLLAVLDHLLGDESLLLVFASTRGIRPETLVPAREALARTLGSETVHE
ncbi:hypothetical protein W911_10185 [Hyphomicrobium nitrativorans NL23]|uniref:DUF3572 domain-containing protein n=1 Tax=Hyphomicrobium nitrativorans NL23 TaxID=1029756 RepID=V5SF52_9HYPH|nr:DUF3572 domain-containing protein [Hyphomicrobium nitrativorans]AHB48675.1 hypothetical protein W911_10185 [Hyphomicrobium nitrativorans NL23]